MNVVVVNYVESTRKASISINGFAAASAEIPANTDPVIYLGAFAQANYLIGDVAEIALFNRNLTPTELFDLQSNWIARYGITYLHHRPFPQFMAACVSR